MQEHFKECLYCENNFCLLTYTNSFSAAEVEVSEPKKKKPGRPKKVKKNEPEQPENLVSSSCQVRPWPQPHLAAFSDHYLFLG